MSPPLPISQEARAIHDQSLVIDLHIDPILQHFFFHYDVNTAHAPTWRPNKRKFLYNCLRLFGRAAGWHHPFFNHIDVPRMLAGGYSGAVFGIHAWPYSAERGWYNALKQLDYFRRLVSDSEKLVTAGSPVDFVTARELRKIACFPDIEGAHCLGTAPGALRLQRLATLYNDYSVRCLTLTHFSKNAAATPAIGWRSNQRDGLSPFGHELIERMNEIGMLIDVAHLNHPGVLDACKWSKDPVIASHAGIASVRPHARNLTDAALSGIVDGGGVIGIMFAMNFLRATTMPASVETVFHHIDYVVQNYGEDFVAIGTDFDGWIPCIPAGMTGAEDLPQLTQIMLTHRYSTERIQKILGGNFLRVWRDVHKSVR